jgi:hypothetical protein
MLENFLGKVGLTALTSILARVFERMDNPAAKQAAETLKQVESQISIGAITINQVKEANRHIEEMARVDSEALKTINQSLQAEVASVDPYVRRMRPTFGYLMALTWAAQMFAVAYIMVFETDKASLVIEAIESLFAIWAVGLSVLGIYVYKRSEDKKLGIGGIIR